MENKIDIGEQIGLLYPNIIYSHIKILTYLYCTIIYGVLLSSCHNVSGKIHSEEQTVNAMLQRCLFSVVKGHQPMAGFV